MNEKKEIFIVGFLVILIIGAGFGISYYLGSKDKDKQDDASTAEEDKAWADAELAKIPGYENYKKVALVGKEYIFEDDIKNYLSVKGEIEKFEDPKARSDALSALIDQSVALQEAEKEGWISLSSDFFNNPLRNYTSRNEKLVQINSSVVDKALDGIYYEGVLIFFINDEGTDVVKQNGRDYAKNLVYNKMKSVYDRVKNGSMSVKEAAETLDNDSEIKSLSRTGVMDSYFAPSLYNPLLDKDSETSDFYSVDQYEILEKTSEGDLTEIMLQETPASGLSKADEVYWSGHYVFYKVLAIRSEGIDSYDSWIEKAKNNYNIEVIED